MELEKLLEDLFMELGDRILTNVCINDYLAIICKFMIVFAQLRCDSETNFKY